MYLLMGLVGVLMVVFSKDESLVLAGAGLTLMASALSMKAYGESREMEEQRGRDN